MPSRKSSLATPVLGRGQAARPAAAPVSREGERTLIGALSVPIEQIVPDPDQPRKARDPERLTELAASIRQYGVLQPLLVREAGLLDDRRTRYMIVVGERRYAAAQLAGQTHLPVVVRDSDGATLRLTQLIENVQRHDLAPLDEARAYKELIDTQQISAQGLAERLHISGQRVRDRLRLLGDQVLADAVERGQISATAARDILTLPTQEAAVLRTRIQVGETVQSADVGAARTRMETEGVVNPRKKGGGRRSHRGSPAETQPPLDDHTTYDPSRPNAAYRDRDPGSSRQGLIADHQLEVVSLLRTGHGWAPRDRVVAALEHDLERLKRTEA